MRSRESTEADITRLPFHPNRSSTKSSGRQRMLLHHLIEKLLIAVHMIIAHKAVRQLFEQLLRAVDLGFFDRTKIEASHASLDLGNEVDVLDLPFIEYNRPVRRIVPKRCGNIESPRQLGVDEHLLRPVKAFRKAAFHALILSIMVDSFSSRAVAYHAAPCCET